MLMERPVKDALRDYLKGKKVVVMLEHSDGTLDGKSMEDIFPTEGIHYLVDVPAAVNPDFEEAVQDMIKGSEMIVSQEDTADQVEIKSKTEESDSMKSQEKELPPPLETPELEEEKIVPAKKEGKRKKIQYDPEVLRKYILDGKSNKEIAELMGVSTATLKSWITENGLTGIRPRGNAKKNTINGSNADRHLCKTCRFRASGNSKVGLQNGCDYAYHNDHSRGCSVEDCNVYEKGNPVAKPKTIGFCGE